MKYKNTIEPFMIRFNESGFNTDTLLIEYFQKIVLPWKRNLNKNVVFLLDQAPCHTSASFLELLDQSEITYIFIPGGCTHIFQPLAVSINKPLKDELRKFYLDWLQRQVLKADVTVVTPPNPDNITDWTLKALNNFSSIQIKDSFKHAGALKNVYDLYNESALSKKLENIVEEYCMNDVIREYMDHGDKIIEDLSLNQELYFSYEIQ